MIRRSKRRGSKKTSRSTDGFRTFMHFPFAESGASSDSGSRLPGWQDFFQLHDSRTRQTRAIVGAVTQKVGLQRAQITTVDKCRYEVERNAKPSDCVSIVPSPKTILRTCRAEYMSIPGLVHSPCCTFCAWFGILLARFLPSSMRQP